MPAALLGGPLLYGQNTDAICNELPPLARHGQNERGVALNRNNALFAGSGGGPDNWAVIATLAENCKLNGIEPHAHLADALTRIVNGHLNSAIDELLPWAYPKSKPLKAVA